MRQYIAAIGLALVLGVGVIGALMLYSGSAGARPLPAATKQVVAKVAAAHTALVHTAAQTVTRGVQSVSARSIHNRHRGTGAYAHSRLARNGYSRSTGR